MSKQGCCEDPGRILAHASGYLWKRWRHYVGWNDNVGAIELRKWAHIIATPRLKDFEERQIREEGQSSLQERVPEVTFRPSMGTIGESAILRGA